MPTAAPPGPPLARLFLLAGLLSIVAFGCNSKQSSAPSPPAPSSTTAAAPGGAANTAENAQSSAPPSAAGEATHEHVQQAKSVEPAKSSEPTQPTPLFAGWPKPTVALVLTGQQLGYIEPCGCSGLENQKGGLARRHTFLRQLADERDWTVVPLDVGSQVKRFGKQQEIKFGHTVQGLRTMGYRAVTLGDGDLRLTPGELLAAIAGPDGAVSDFVGSNVAVLARELQPRFLVIEAGGRKIGVTAVVGEKYESKLRGDELVHQPPLDALKEVAGELKAKACDFYVLLAHAPLDEAKKLAQAAPMFDLVVASGETTEASHELENIEGTKSRLMQVGQKAMYAGVVGLFEDAQTPVRYQSVPLDARFADSPDMLRLLADYQDRLKEMGLAELGVKPRPHPTGRKFVGTAKCGECHTAAYKTWQETKHAHATDSLVAPPNSRGAIARLYDPECLSCHVTGWEPQLFYPYDSGYLSLEKTPHLQHSGCENCHGPGSAHVAAENGDGNPSADAVAKLREDMKLPLAGAEKKCIECHDPDNSPDFHKPGAFEKYWKDVEHKGKD